MVAGHDQAFACIGGMFNQVLVALQGYLQQLPDLRFVVYYQYLWLIHCLLLNHEVFTGIKIVKQAPPSFPRLRLTVPPNASVKPFTMESPNPDPPARVSFLRENL